MKISCMATKQVRVNAAEIMLTKLAANIHIACRHFEVETMQF